jgi:hypothetical protein
MSVEPSSTEAAIERAWSCYLKDHPQMTRLALEAGARAALANWLRRHSDEHIPAIARAVANGQMQPPRGSERPHGGVGSSRGADGNDSRDAPMRAPTGGAELTEPGRPAVSGNPSNQ